jgi:hypothetical protein
MLCEHLPAFMAAVAALEPLWHLTYAARVRASLHSLVRAAPPADLALRSGRRLARGAV